MLPAPAWWVVVQAGTEHGGPPGAAVRSPRGVTSLRVYRHRYLQLPHEL